MVKFTEAELARQRDANRIHELEQQIEELEAENRTAADLPADCLSNHPYEQLVKQDAGKKLSLSKHMAGNAVTCRRIIDELESAGMRDAHSWAIWMVWWQVTCDQREQCIIDDFRERVEEMEVENTELREQNLRLWNGFQDCLGYYDADNLTMQSKKREWESILHKNPNTANGDTGE